MEKLLFIIIVALTAGLIYLLTGRNRRQINRIPKGMMILCQPPGKRYVVYALALLVVVVVGIFGVLYIMDGAPEEARSMWILAVAVTILSAAILIFSGNVMARDCIYFNSVKIQIEKAFQKPKVFKWHEIRRIDGSFDNRIHLYLLDGTKVLSAGVDLVNYDVFCKMLRKKCPEIVSGYYSDRSDDSSQKHVLRYGPENYILIGLGVLLMLMYLVLVIHMDDFDLMQRLSQSSTLSELFSLLFAPVCDVVSLIFLFVVRHTSIHYSDEKMNVKYPLRREREVYWRNIRRIEVVTMKKRGEETWKKLRMYTDQGTYRFHLEFLTSGADDFIEEVEKMIEKYDIPSTFGRLNVIIKMSR